jgi:nitric oxide reductase NorF protein
MNPNHRTNRITRTLGLLVGLTACTLGASLGLDIHGAKLALAIGAALIAVGKVRLVVLDFMKMRGFPSALAPALVSWAAAVLSVAVALRILSINALG